MRLDWTGSQPLILKPIISTQQFSIAGYLFELVGGGTSSPITLIARNAPAAAPAYVHVVESGGFWDQPAFEAWLGAAEAVLIRPDRYVFGTGSGDRLIAALQAALR